MTKQLSKKQTIQQINKIINDDEDDGGDISSDSNKSDVDDDLQIRDRSKSVIQS